MESLQKAVNAVRCAMAVSLAVGYSQVSAADNCSGYDAEVNKSYEQIELSKGNVVSSFTNHSIITSQDYPIANGEMGECYGTWLVTTEGLSMGSGFCAWKDKDGDTEYAQWEANAEAGTWKDLGGTGKWAGKHYSGWSKMAAKDGKMSLVRWGGNCK